MMLGHVQFSYITTERHNAEARSTLSILPFPLANFFQYLSHVADVPRREECSKATGMQGMKDRKGVEEEGVRNRKEAEGERDMEKMVEMEEQNWKMYESLEER
ncbi:hypothetical protein KM043_002603 [Ampulex compressa]|nr:hypothetical protein KM043_002603 [Ampulex compressa]